MSHCKYGLNDASGSTAQHTMTVTDGEAFTAAPLSIRVELADQDEGHPVSHANCNGTTILPQTQANYGQNGLAPPACKNVQCTSSSSSSSIFPPASESSPLTNLMNDQKMNSFCGKAKLGILHLLKSILLLFFPSWTFAKFFAHATIPALADNLVPLFFIGNIPNESALALAGQFTFIGVIVEVIQEGIVNSLFFYVGRNYTVNRGKSLEALKLCLVILAGLGAILTGFMVLLNSQFVNFIDTPESLVEATREFLYTSSFSFPLLLVSAGLSNFLLITASSYLILAQLSSVTLSFLCNFFLFGQQEYSLHWNIEQLGYYKVIQTSLSCVNSFVFTLLIERLGPLEFTFRIPITHQLRSNFRQLARVSWGNFGDSAVRNFFYFVVTLKFINNLGETEVAAWNLLNTIVWGLLLIPSFTIANYAKVKIGHNGTKAVIRGVAKNCIKSLIVWLGVVSTLSLVFWPELADFFGSSNDGAKSLSVKLFHEMGWIFIVFSVNNTMDSLFFGLGATKYVFYQSAITNLVVYFVPWILYLCRVITPTYWIVVGLYIGGMLVDFCLTSYYCVIVWRRTEDLQ